MKRTLLATGGVMTFSLTLFKIAMPYLFDWKSVMASSAVSMWKILFSENLGISLVLLFFAYMSIFQWRELLSTRLGKSVLLCMVALWIFRTVVEILLFEIGSDGAWWRVGLFLVLVTCYLVPLFLNGLSQYMRNSQAPFVP